MLPTIQPYPFIFNYFMAATKQTSLPTQRELSLVCRHTPSAVKEGSLTTQNTAVRDEGHWERRTASGTGSASGERVNQGYRIPGRKTYLT